MGGSHPTRPACVTTRAFGTSASLEVPGDVGVRLNALQGRFCRVWSRSVVQRWRGDRQTSGGRCRVLTDFIGKDRSSAGAPATTSRLRAVRPEFLRRNKEDASIGSEGVPGIDG